MRRKNIFIIMPAYNAADYIEKVMDRIPALIWEQINQLVFVNDGSTDNTFKLIKKLQKKYQKIKVIHKKTNQGYSQAQKTAYDYCLNNNAEVVAMLHSDGQYAPELLPKLLKPLINGKADIVQGSRIKGGKALQGKMPLYKYISNRFLSKLENFVFGMNLYEYHSGYMLYTKNALDTIPYKKLSDTFHIDGEMLFMGHKKGLRIKEIPIPTDYSGQKSSLKPVQYGIHVIKIMVNYKLGKYNF